MELTGKCKGDFEKWLDKKYVLNNRVEINRFKEYPEAMQYGDYVDFFDVVGICVDIQPILDYDGNSYIKVLNYAPIIVELNTEEDLDAEVLSLDTRHEARTYAINKANEIFNENK